MTFTINKLKTLPLLLLLVLVVFQTGCRKLVEVDPPPTLLTSENTFKADATAISFVTGLYARMGTGIFTGSQSISLFSGLSADEWKLFSGISGTDNKYLYYSNDLFANQTAGTEFWNPLYNYVFLCNTAIEGLEASTSLTSSVKQQLLGEVKFMRAFYYFYLVNLYGAVPLALTTDYKANALLSRAPENTVYQQIKQDLSDAQDLMTEIYPDATLLKASSERVRPNKWAAKAMLARVYLYMKDWTGAEMQASDLINNSNVFAVSTLANSFLRAGLGNKEAIWQLQPINTGWNTEDARVFIIPTTGMSGSYQVQLSDYLLNAFEPFDQRRYNKNWIDSVIVAGVRLYYPNKYKSATLNAPVNEYLMVLRLAEQYLIRAEARAQMGNLQGAIDDVNFVRLKHGSLSNPLSVPVNLDAAVTTILHERQVELFTEWGHRWLDLKRTGRIDNVMTAVTTQKTNGSISWRPYQQYYPISLSELQRGINLTQTPGYQ